MERNGVILIDKDDTLFDARTETLTDNRITSLIAACQANGWLVGLNSDSPAKALVTVALSLGMKGPIIAENGAVILSSPSAQSQYTLPRETMERFVAIRHGIKHYGRKEGGFVIEGDVVLLRAQGLPVRWPNGTRLTALNALREASAMCFCWRADDDGNLRPDPVGLEELDTHLTGDGIAHAHEMCVRTNPKYGVLTVHAAVTSKAYGVSSLLQQVAYERVIMIGDSMHDLCGTGITHVAVGNAETGFLKQAEVRMDRPYTQGVCDFLAQLTNGEQLS